MRFTPFAKSSCFTQRMRLLLLAFASFQVIFLPLTSPAQENGAGEIVANLATGRVIFCVTRDAIIVAATSGGGEIGSRAPAVRSEEHTSELQSRGHLVCRLLLEKKKPTVSHLISMLDIQ